MTRSRSAMIAAFCLSALAALASSCASSPDPNRYTIIFRPDFSQFAGDSTGKNPGVHLFLEKQCGTLDCHGQVGRPFRLFSAGGLRARNDAGSISGIGGDTPDEIYANYVSLVGLEPEEMSRVVAGEDPPTELLVVKKPRGAEGHKGGIRIVEGDPEDLCLTGWLGAPSGAATFDPGTCLQASQAE